MIDKLVAVLGKDLNLTPEEIADILWLSLQRQEICQTIETSSSPEIVLPTTEESISTPNSNITPILPEIPKAKVYPESDFIPNTNSTIPLPIPDAPSLRTPLTLAQSLRPLMRRVASGQNTILDETATVDYVANQDIFVPVFKPEPEPWLDLALVVDESESMLIWRHTIRELKRLLEHYGVFRDVRTWGLVVSSAGNILIRPGINREANDNTQRLANPGELIDTTGRRLILLVSDCVANYWQTGAISDILKLWANTQPVAIIQMLPDWLWLQTGLNAGASVLLGSLAPGVANKHLRVKELLLWKDIDLETGTKIPVLTLEPELALTWSQVVAGRSDATVRGFVFEQGAKKTTKSLTNRQPPTINAEERVQHFQITASPIARKLASLLAAAPLINLPVVRIIQDTILPNSRQVNVAEVFLGGLLTPLDKIKSDTNPDTVRYCFINGIREIFLESAVIYDSAKVFYAVSEYVARKLGKPSLSEFFALLKAPQQGNEDEQTIIQPIAEVAITILKSLGEDYARFAEELENPTSQPTSIVGNKKQETENLGNNVTLDMVAIPGGTFLMGAPEDEEGSYDSERPQHEVTVQPFFMGKYPVTQAQWRAVAALPQINRELELEPSLFKGNDLPVECVSWYDAMEFCDRLTNYSRRNYRLPSEAEWEYACRAGTATPFHFGETITSELANFDGTREPYADAPKGEYREKTTDVGSFPPNAFGLYDMHGNVWEWCADIWHENYLEAPTDGSAWIQEKVELDSENDNQYYPLRGGARKENPRNCRSACRDMLHPGLADFLDDLIGFRVVCGGVASALLYESWRII